jgi:hypothetical protein
MEALDMFKKLCIAAALAAFALPLLATPARADEHDFKVVNKGGHQVDHIYISPISADKWGPDQLDANQVLAPGDSQTYKIDTNCEMDVRIVYHDSHVDVEKDVDTCKYDLDLNY